MGLFAQAGLLRFSSKEDTGNQVMCDQPECSSLWTLHLGSRNI